MKSTCFNVIPFLFVPPGVYITFLEATVDPVGSIFALSIRGK